MCGPSLCFWGRSALRARRISRRLLPSPRRHRPLSLQRRLLQSHSPRPRCLPPRRQQPSRNQPETAQAPASADPVVAAIRSKLSDPAIRKDANAADLAALEAFYATRPGALWVTEMGFSARAQAALFEIGEAEDWGLDAAVLRAAAGRRAATDPRRAGHRRDQARSRHSQICALRQGRAAQPARGE